jgi:hypothetical protein
VASTAPAAPPAPRPASPPRVTKPPVVFNVPLDRDKDHEALHRAEGSFLANRMRRQQERLQREAAEKVRPTPCWVHRNSLAVVSARHLPTCAPPPASRVGQLPSPTASCAMCAVCCRVAGSVWTLQLASLTNGVFGSRVLCCAVLCCAVLCCAVLCCAVLCCAVLCCAVLCCRRLRRPPTLGDPHQPALHHSAPRTAIARSGRTALLGEGARLVHDRSCRRSSSRW